LSEKIVIDRSEWNTGGGGGPDWGGRRGSGKRKKKTGGIAGLARERGREKGKKRNLTGKKTAALPLVFLSLCGEEEERGELPSRSVSRKKTCSPENPLRNCGGRKKVTS